MVGSTGPFCMAAQVGGQDSGSALLHMQSCQREPLAVHAAKFAPAEEGDLEDDFLAELLAEEAAAKKALEEEAAAESKRLKDEAKAAKKAPPPKATKKKKKKSSKKKKGEL